MRVLIVCNKEKIDQLGQGLQESMVGKLEEMGNEVQHFDVARSELKTCLGCFGCWIKKPGMCIMRDKQDDFNEAFIKSDIVIFLTKITYGTYEPAVKRVLDRSIPNVLPYFTKIKGEMHHQARYKKYPEIIAVGYGEDLAKDEIQTFKGIVQANANNFHSAKSKSFICKDLREVEKVIVAVKDYCNQLEGK